MGGEAGVVDTSCNRGSSVPGSFLTGVTGSLAVSPSAFPNADPNNEEPVSLGRASSVLPLPSPVKLGTSLKPPKADGFSAGVLAASSFAASSSVIVASLEKPNSCLGAGVPKTDVPAPSVDGAPKEPLVVEGRVIVEPKLGCGCLPSDCPAAAKGEALVSLPPKLAKGEAAGLLLPKFAKGDDAGLSLCVAPKLAKGDARVFWP